MTNTIHIQGAGIMGLMVAYTLADDHNITITDPRGFPADNASLIAGGMLAPYSEIEHMNLQWVQAGLDAIEIWQNTPLETGFSNQGSLLIAHPDDSYILERFKTHLPHKNKTYQNVQSIEPSIIRNFQNGIFLSEEAHLDPAKTINALCEYLNDHPNVILEKDIATTQNADITIDCRGMASNDNNLRGVKGEICIARNPDFQLKRPVRLMHPRYPLYIIPREDHTFMIGATVIESSDNNSVSLRSSMELMSALYTLHPSFADAEILSLKAGIRPSYSDNLPRIGINEDNNTITCNGLFRHGYLISPIMAACVRDHINGKENAHMHLFRKEGHENNHQRAA
ncbi:MAG: FAD-dependent oxidoreductase [Bdellovibrionales bacterium]